MRSTFICLTLVWSILIVVFGLIGAAPCITQTRVTSLDELRHELAAGDFITFVPAVGQTVAGRLMRLGNLNLDVRLVNAALHRSAAREMSPSAHAVQSLERPRDSTRNGAAIGARIGADSAEPCSSMPS